jgi:hypothetical protein
MEPNEPLEADEPDIQDLISRWAGESKRLLIALPGVLAKLEDLQEDTGRLRERVTDLERENLALRQSREELAETFTKLKALIAGTTVAPALAEIDVPRPRWPQSPVPSPEPPTAERVSDRHASEPAPHREAPVSARPPSPPVEPPSPPAPPARPPASAGSPEPNARVLREDKPPKSEEPAPPSTSVRFASVFRPPTRS